MAVKPAELEVELIDAVCARVQERLPAEQAGPCAEFVRQYYHWVPPEDLAERSRARPLRRGRRALEARSAARARDATRSASTTRTSSSTAGSPRTPWSRSSPTTCRSSSTR